MIRRVAVWLLGAYCIGATLFLLLGGAAPDSDEAAEDTPNVHDVSYVRLADETTARLGDFAGQPIVLNFFASTCAPCVLEMPDLEQIHQSRSDEVTVVGLAVEGLRPARGVVAERGVTYETGLNPPGDLLIDLGGFGMPTTVFIDERGNVVQSHTGALTAAQLNEKIDELFGAQVQ